MSAYRGKVYRAMTKDEALRALEDRNGHVILSATAAEEIAAAFGLQPEVHQLTDERFDSAILYVDRRADEMGIWDLDLLMQVARHEGISTQSRYYGRGRRFRELLDRMRAHVAEGRA
jgi:predicted mannosyl-3-phosphoglycerate phosphatase (HAD superfamily)